MRETTVQLKGISHIYERKTIKELTDERRITALDNINLDILKNETLVLLGPSGSGKTTLLNIISTILVPTTGALLINRSNPFSMEKNSLQSLRWSEIGYLQQNIFNNFFSEWSLKENIEALKMNEIDKKNKYNQNKIQKYINQLGLQKINTDLPLKMFSGGELQRISLLLILLRNPNILILDEPTSFLDKTRINSVIELLEEEQNKGKTIIISSHDPVFTEISDKIVFLMDGQILQSNSLQFLTETLLGDVWIKGKNPSKDYLLEIPEPIYHYLVKNQIYYLELIDKHCIKFQVINTNIFKEDDRENWIFLDSSEFVLPKLIQNKIQLKKTVSWGLVKGSIIICFK